MNAEALTELNGQIASCTACALHQGRTQTVPGDGDPNAEILFIGEAPGFNEDQQGSPFVGQAGRVLDQLLLEIELTRADVFVANVIKCRPPNNRDPLPEEIATCEPFLTEQIRGIRPKLIVTLGRFALQYFLPGASISRARGKPVRREPYLLYPVYHPAAALRQGKLLQVLRDDFRRIPPIVADAERPSAEAVAISAAPPVEEASSATQLQLL